MKVNITEQSQGYYGNLQHFKGADRRYEQISDDDPNLRRVDRVQLFLKMLNSISIVEVARTGTHGAAEMPRSGKLNEGTEQLRR